MKRVAKAIGRKEINDARALIDNAPMYNLIALIFFYNILRT
jgi:hypothetical protein